MRVKKSLLPLFLVPTVPFHARVAEEGAAHVSVHGHGGGGVYEHGVCPPSLTVGGTGRWVLREGCEALGILPSETKPKSGTHLSVTFS